ncbi:hypothetical protein [Amycolatopsis cihanbeyliensis]|uniref:Uncharacterized protein n=1 Tax=Amycolatopsis cihanbeyliensis TaxID=1128664 RepID=A0A542DM63_AMYCI|nr:hypothetical protein [Amycolatopsis cihanbeyliensis]TQJ04181.1 hypothetical protein FB471_3963 [Amycolatopsis cihanbeyliensis]
MADEKLALVLHLTAGGEPLLFSLETEEAQRLEPKLAQLVKHNAVEPVRTRDGMTVTVNFAHVAVTYVDDMQRKGTVFGMHR